MPCRVDAAVGTGTKISTKGIHHFPLTGPAGGTSGSDQRPLTELRFLRYGRLRSWESPCKDSCKCPAADKMSEFRDERSEFARPHCGWRRKPLGKRDW